LSAVRATQATLAPERAKASANVLPRPREAPVTRATCPERSTVSPPAVSFAMRTSEIRIRASERCSLAHDTLAIGLAVDTFQQASQHTPRTDFVERVVAL